jgi:hypothetical protein
MDGINQARQRHRDYGIYNMPYKIPHRQHERHNVKTSYPELDASRPRRQPARFHGEVFVDEMAMPADGIRSNGASR